MTFSHNLWIECNFCFSFSVCSVPPSARTLCQASSGAEYPQSADQRTEDSAPALRPTPRPNSRGAHAAVQGPQPRARQGHTPAQEGVRAGARTFTLVLYFAPHISLVCMLVLFGGDIIVLFLGGQHHRGAPVGRQGATRALSPHYDQAQVPQ